MVRRKSALKVNLYTVTMLVLVVFAISGYFLIKAQMNFEIQLKEKFFRHKKKYVSQMIEITKKWLLSEAFMIARDAAVRESYEENNPEIIKKQFAPLWKKLHAEFHIEEMHFFKYPDINWFCFAKMTAEPCKADVRKDILWIESAFKPAAYFYVCRRFPGLRASYPVVINSKVVGALSFGIHIETLREILQEPVNARVFYLLNRKILEEHLEKNIYKKILKESDFSDGQYLYFHIKTGFAGRVLRQGTYARGERFYVFYPMKDESGKIIGYIGIEKGFNGIFSHIKNTTLTVMFTFLAVFCIVFLVSLLNIYHLKKQRREVLYLLRLLRKRQFDELENYHFSSRPTGDVNDEIRRNIYEIGVTLKKYIDLLCQRLKEASQKAFIDALTNTNNRYVLEKIEEMLEKMGEDATFSVIMIDVDHFKKINDSYGHEAGDKVLKEVVDKIRSLIRSSDILIRYGGEEFIIYLPHTTASDALKLAERIRKNIEDMVIEVPGGKKVKVTVSLGVAQREPGESLEEVIKKADEALYRAKESGRNRVSD
ncbi:diguanylate cyclase [Desulfurobacterium sp.]